MVCVRLFVVLAKLSGCVVCRLLLANYHVTCQEIWIVGSRCRVATSHLYFCLIIGVAGFRRVRVCPGVEMVCGYS